jgi:hypothetical protein
MPTRGMKLAPLATALIAIGATAHADTRSSNALPKNPTPLETQAKGNPQGSTIGFPDNHGLERAREVANEHARFQRHDSEG